MYVGPEVEWLLLMTAKIFANQFIPCMDVIQRQVPVRIIELSRAPQERRLE